MTTKKYGFVLVKNGYSLEAYRKAPHDQYALPKGLLMIGIRKYIKELTGII